MGQQRFEWFKRHRQRGSPQSTTTAKEGRQRGERRGWKRVEEEREEKREQEREVKSKQ